MSGPSRIEGHIGGIDDAPGISQTVTTPQLDHSEVKALIRKGAKLLPRLADPEAEVQLQRTPMQGVEWLGITARMPRSGIPGSEDPSRVYRIVFSASGVGNMINSSEVEPHNHREINGTSKNHTLEEGKRILKSLRKPQIRRVLKFFHVS